MQSEETYILEFEQDQTQQDTAMREASDDWLQMNADKRKGLDEKAYVCESAVLMVMAVRPCVTDGENLFEESEEVNWQEGMRESTWAHQDRMEMVQEARIVEMEGATREGRVYVVSCTTRLVTSAHQARGRWRKTS